MVSVPFFEFKTKFPLHLQCAFDGCTRKRVSRDTGLCKAHYEHHMQGRKLEPLRIGYRFTDITEKPIEDIVVGDRVVSYQSADRGVSVKGRRVSAVSRFRYDGELIRVTLSGGRSSAYTPKHHCIVRFGDEIRSKFVTYLMRRGNQFRVGIAPGAYRSSATAHGAFGLRMRFNQECADAAWILDVFDTKADAAHLEAMVMARYGIPGTRFQPTSKNDVMDVRRFWLELGDNSDRAAVCLTDHGRLMEFPLVTAGRANPVGLRNIMVTAAANLMDGMMACPIEASQRLEGKRTYSVWNGWERITVAREDYHGDIISLEVEEHHSYFGDGVLTHNSFAGAENSIAKMIEANPDTTRTTLTQSWRFGQPVADVANRVLELLPTDMVVRGNPGLASTVGDVTDPHVILTRTNAAAVNALLRGQREGRRAHLVGGGDQVLHFAQGSQALQTGGNTSHPDLACFDNWGAVQEYVKLDMQGDELRLLVSLVDDFGAATIIHALGSMPDERHADLVISTAHKAKGRQWETVQLAGDFPAEIESMSDEELRLLYVAVTRAQMRLDAEAVPWVVGEMQTPPAPVQAAQEPASGLHPLWRRQPEMATRC